MTKRKPAPDWITLLEQILTDRPNLSGALCIGQHELFDAARFPEAGKPTLRARSTAEKLCRSCLHALSCPDTLATRKDQSA
ncbi:hypothetical protein GS504_20725 [Rhodococcus hoagii]|nr:hypothetical protein [Prescottella equi]NKS59876.1 hypothetical protein [Prescottella equi]NKS70683.1 hypothetical protein [Prescottella equi]